MNRQTNVLLVEDNPGDADLICSRLMEAKSDLNISIVDRLSDALEKLDQHPPSLVLLDLNLPDSRGADTFRRVLRKAPGVPVVILSGREDEELAVDAVHQGVQDYLVKGTFDSSQLVRSIRYAIERQETLASIDTNRKRQLQFKDQLLSDVSHELRTPLTSVHQFVTILLDGLAGSVSKEQREHLETILRSVNQLCTIIADLLEAAQAESGKSRIEKRCVPINEVVQHAVSMLQVIAREKGVRLEVEVDSRPLLVCADPDRVLQVLTNLIHNAIKFSPRDGVVIVKASLVAADPEFVYISVSDTGCGVAPEARPLIFERLYQEINSRDGSRKGLGLGLYIVRELVRLHGGRIWLESREGPGSIFTFTLPQFPLVKFLIPVITTQNRLHESVSLITLEVTPKFVTESGEWRKSRAQCLELLRLCTLPNKVLLMPLLASTRATETFLIVASTNLEGAQVILERIRTQLDGCPDLQTAASVWLSATSIPMPVVRDRGLQQLVQQIADTITEMVMATQHRKAIFETLGVQVES